MAFHNGSLPIVGSGLTFCIDASDRHCYPGTGTTVTDLVGGLQGTLNGGASTVVTTGGYFDFDETADGLDLPNSSTTPSTDVFSFGSNPYSICCFYKYIGDQVMWSAGQTGNDNHYISITSTFLGLGTGNAYIHQVSRTNNDDTWFQWVLVREGTGSNQSKWYINGSLASTGTNNITWISVGTQGQRICRFSHAPAEGLVGPIQVYNRALTASEVSQNFNAQRGRFGV
jgi:hypothetical protein